MPDGTEILVTWSGGNGRHRHRMGTDRWGNRRIINESLALDEPATHIGRHPLTQVCLPSQITNSRGTMFIVFDLDGTLADESHRNHLAVAGEWNAYFEGIEDDEACLPNCSFAQTASP